MHKTINTTRKPIFLYPGRDNNNNYPAVALGNAFIVGSTGTGKTVLLKVFYTN